MNVQLLKAARERRRVLKEAFAMLERHQRETTSPQTIQMASGPVMETQRSRELTARLEGRQL